jgi:hypothetical protein
VLDLAGVDDDLFRVGRKAWFNSVQPANGTGSRTAQ